jgi:hypothetical protein
MRMRRWLLERASVGQESDARAVMKAIQAMAAQLTTIDGNTDLIL